MQASPFGPRRSKSWSIHHTKDAQRQFSRKLPIVGTDLQLPDLGMPITAPKTTRLLRRPIAMPVIQSMTRKFCSNRFEIAIRIPRARHMISGTKTDVDHETGSSEAEAQAPLTNPTKTGKVS